MDYVKSVQQYVVLKTVGAYDFLFHLQICLGMLQTQCHWKPPNNRVASKWVQWPQWETIVHQIQKQKHLWRPIKFYYWCCYVNFTHKKKTKKTSGVTYRHANQPATCLLSFTITVSVVCLSSHTTSNCLYVWLDESANDRLMVILTENLPLLQTVWPHQYMHSVFQDANVWNKIITVCVCLWNSLHLHFACLLSPEVAVCSNGKSENSPH